MHRNAEKLNIDYFYEKTRSQIEHEDHLINHRLTWLFTLNGFLFTAYGFSLSIEPSIDCTRPEPELCNHVHQVQNYMAVAGICSSFVLLLGIIAAGASMRALAARCKRELKNRKLQAEYPQIIGEKFLGMYGGLLPTWFLPLIFCLVWFNVQPNSITILTSSGFILVWVVFAVIVALFFSVFLYRRVHQFFLYLKTRQQKQISKQSNP